MSTTLNRPNLIARAVMVLAAIGAIVAVVLVASGGSSYVLKLRMANASGLRPGSQVLLGGVSVGTVYALELDRHNNTVIADLHLSKGDVRVGQGVRVSVVAANLLGEKYVALTPGNPGQPLPSGTILPASATTLPTDLDQVVDVLDGGTRARLAILMREAGIAVAGRQHDVGAIVRQFPLSLDAATKLLTTMVHDNHTLGDLVATSNGFVSRLNGQSADLKAAIDSASGAATTFASRAGALKQTVTLAPFTINRIYNVFFQGTKALDDLIPVLTNVNASAPRLNALLRQVKPFTAAAVPTLNRAASVAPTLNKLADQATPTVKLAVPTLSSLSNVAKLAQPLSTWIGLSSSDLFNIFDGWTHAIQFRDGISHVFNGDIYMNASVILNVADQGATPAQKRQNLLDVLNPAVLRGMGLLGAQNRVKAQGGAPTPSAKPGKAAAVASSKRSPSAASKPTAAPVSSSGAGAGTSSGLGGLLGGVLGGLGSHGSASGSGTGASTASSNGSSGGSAGQQVGSSLHSLLSYLLGK